MQDSNAHHLILQSQLSSDSNLTSFTDGSGLSIFQKLILPAILNAKDEVILATCFWAPSDTVNELAATLRQLSQNRLNTNQVKVYICLSSRSITQKLFHTSSPAGHTYSPAEWVQHLGLPGPEEVPGLEMSCKSLFFRPFSVLHSKYIIIDRTKVFLPSCNVSWEEWYECCVGFEGPIVQQVFEFWRHVWEPTNLLDSQAKSFDPEANVSASNTHLLRTELLPHPHDASLRQAIWFLPNSEDDKPSTPLSQALLQLLMNARSEIIMLTPNLTSQPAFLSICRALRDGVNVRLITNRRMMVPEQLATAGTVTEQYVNKLVKEYKRNFQGRRLKRSLKSFAASVLSDRAPKQTSNVAAKTGAAGKRSLSGFEALPLGSLKIYYFETPRIAAKRDEKTSPRYDKSHIKLTLIDRRSMVLGSGNMDRASWTTSQELGVLIEDHNEEEQSVSIIHGMWRQIEFGLENRLEEYFNSEN